MGRCRHYTMTIMGLKLMHFIKLLQLRVKQMRLLLLITATGIVVACSSETRNVSEMGEPADEKQDSISFQRPEMSGLTADVTKWVSILLNLDRSPLWHTYSVNDTTFLYVGWGEKPTGGYDVSVRSMEISADHEILVTVDFQSPSPDDMVTQALTYPFDLISFPVQDNNLIIQPEGRDAPRQVLTITGDQQLQPILSGSESIKLFKPAGGESVRPGFEVSGIASVFEATVNYRIYSSSGEILAESYTTATDGMNWGFFTFEPEFENQPEMGQDILLELYNINAKDGKELNDFRVPLIYTGN
jgi:hypothetical protein